MAGMPFYRAVTTSVLASCSAYERPGSSDAENGAEKPYLQSQSQRVGELGSAPGSLAPGSVCVATALSCSPNSCSSACFRLALPLRVDGGGWMRKGALIKVCRITR